LVVVQLGQDQVLEVALERRGGLVFGGRLGGGGRAFMRVKRGLAVQRNAPLPLFAELTVTRSRPGVRG
jgi:hypothetical protein